MKPIIMAIKKLLKYTQIDYLPRLIQVSFLGNLYEIRNGVIDDGDYDDAWMLAIAFHSKYVFDIGANIGQSTFLMLHSSNVDNIVLIEPAPFALTIAADTLIRNQMSDRVHFINAYVTDRSDDSVFYDARGHSTGAKALSKSQVQSDRSRRTMCIPTVTADSMVRRLNILPDFVKIDVEGLEGKVLKGCSEIAKHNCTRFMIEMHSSEQRPQSLVTQEIIAWCKEVDYIAWYMKTGEQLSSPSMVAHRGRYHALLQPKSFEYPLWLKNIPQGTPVDIEIFKELSGQDD